MRKLTPSNDEFLLNTGYFIPSTQQMLVMMTNVVGQSDFRAAVKSKFSFILSMKLWLPEFVPIKRWFR